MVTAIWLCLKICMATRGPPHEPVVQLPGRRASQVCGSLDERRAEYQRQRHRRADVLGQELAAPR
jgi:hypothetical protein